MTLTAKDEKQLLHGVLSMHNGVPSKVRENKKKIKQRTCRTQEEMGEESFTKMLKENKLRLSKVIQRKRKWEQKSEQVGSSPTPFQWEADYLPWSAPSKPTDQTSQQNLSLFPGTSLVLNLFILSCHT